MDTETRKLWDGLGWSPQRDKHGTIDLTFISQSHIYSCVPRRRSTLGFTVTPLPLEAKTSTLLDFVSIFFLILKGIRFLEGWFSRLRQCCTRGFYDIKVDLTVASNLLLLKISRDLTVIPSVAGFGFFFFNFELYLMCSHCNINAPLLK